MPQKVSENGDPSTEVGVDPKLADLVELVGKGEQEPFRELYCRTSGSVFGIARSVLLDVSQAEEVTQEVYLEIWRVAARFDRARGSAFSWICTLARSRAVDRVRRSQAARDRDTAYWRSQVLDCPDSALDHLVRKADGVQLRAAVAALTPKRRDAITLAFFEELSHTEASSQLGVPLSTLKTRIRDGLIALGATK